MAVNVLNTGTEESHSLVKEYYSWQLCSVNKIFHYLLYTIQ